MQDYPHYKYRPRRKKKEGTSSGGGTLPGVSGSGGPSSGPSVAKGGLGSKDDQPAHTKRPQPPEPAYLQRVKEDPSLRSTSPIASGKPSENNNHEAGGVVETPESSPNESRSGYQLIFVCLLFCEDFSLSKSKILFKLPRLSVHPWSIICNPCA